MDQLAEKFSQLTILGSFLLGLQNVASTYQELNSRLFEDSLEKSSTFQFGLSNIAISYQALLHDSTIPVQRVLLSGAQEGLVLIVTS